MSYVNTRFNMPLILSHSCYCFDTVISFSERLTQKGILIEGDVLIHCGYFHIAVVFCAAFCSTPNYN